MSAIPEEMFTFCQVLNGFPLKYKANSKGNGYVTFCWTSFLWGVTMVVIQVVVSILAITKDFLDTQKGKPIRMRTNTAVIAITLDTFTLNLMSVTVFCTSVRQHAKFINMCSMLNKIDELLPQKLTEPRLRIKLWMIVSYTVILLLGSIFVETRGYMRFYGYNGFYFYYPQYTTYLAQASLFVQFTRVSNAISRRFREVNRMIKEEVVKASCSRNWRFCLPQIDTVSEGFPTHKIQTLIDLYWQLFEAVHLANSFFSCQLLVAVFSSFIHIVITLYYFFLHFWPVFKSHEIAYMVLQACWVPSHLAHIILLLWPSSAVSQAADETAPMICKLMNRNLNLEMRDKLESFLLQLLHHNARFSALGFFQVHRNILPAMAGSVTTYLVILIQFQTTSEPNSSSQHSR